MLDLGLLQTLFLWDRNTPAKYLWTIMKEQFNYQLEQITGPICESMICKTNIRWVARVRQVFEVETNTATQCVKLYDAHGVNHIVHNDMYTNMNMHEII